MGIVISIYNTHQILFILVRRHKNLDIYFIYLATTTEYTVATQGSYHHYHTLLYLNYIYLLYIQM